MCTHDNCYSILVSCKSGWYDGWDQVSSFDEFLDVFWNSSHKFVEDIFVKGPDRFQKGPDKVLWEGVHPAFLAEQSTFDCFWATKETGKLWALPFIAVPVYIVMLVFLPGYVQRQVSGRDIDKGQLYAKCIKPSIIAWNLFLALFSMAGAVVTIPHLVGTWSNEGFRATVCWHSSWFGNGYVGLFTALFIYR